MSTTTVIVVLAGFSMLVMLLVLCLVTGWLFARVRYQRRELQRERHGGSDDRPRYAVRLFIVALVFLVKVWLWTIKK
jgi:Ca2+/Na+ antiporter